MSAIDSVVRVGESPRAAVHAQSKSIALARYQPLLIAAILLIVALSRIPRLPYLEPDMDEAWSVWHTIGTPQQIVDWTPYDEPPLSYLLIGAWRGFVGINPTVVRLLSVYTFMLGGAILYRVARRLHGDTAGVVALIAYGAFGYGVVVSTWMRLYVFILALTPLALWLTLRYFARPTFWRALPLAVCMAALIYIHSTTAFMFLFLGLYTLIRYRAQAWRWWLPGIMGAAFALPEIINKAKHTLDRASAERIPLAPMPEQIRGLFANFAGWGAAPILWLALFIVATILIIYRQRLKSSVIALLVWVLSPFALYYIGPLVGVFAERHFVWVMVGVVIWIGWGLAYLPRPLTMGASALLIVAMFAPLSPTDRIQRPPLESTMRELRKNIQWGDVIVVDPNCKAASADEWDYYTQVYFPNGLLFVKNPAGYRRVWYVKADGWQDKALDAQVHQNRVEGMFFGPWYFLFRLYEAPPDVTGVPFENGLRFHGADILGRAANGMPSFRTKETVTMRLWWSIDHAIDRDYSVGVYLIDWRKGGTLLQVDAPPQVMDVPRETSRWITGRYYVEERQITLPDVIHPGQYAITMAVYFWQDGRRIPAPGVDETGALPIQSINVKSFP